MCLHYMMTFKLNPDLELKLRIEFIYIISFYITFFFEYLLTLQVGNAHL